MARSLCEAIERHGKKVPEDVMICGFDNAMESREYHPQLTTVGLDYEVMTKETIQLIHDVLNGVKREQTVRVPANVIYRESCGCHECDDVNESDHIQFKTANEVLDQHMEQLYFSIDMHSCNNLQDIKSAVGQGLNLVGDYDEFYLCRFYDYNLQDGIHSLTGDMPVNIEFGFKDGKLIKNYTQFYQKELLPESVSDSSLKVYYFRILHNREKSFGYTVISYKNRTDSLYAFYHDWNLTISLALNDYYVRQQMEELIAINKNNSLKDYMTKVNNRLGLDDYLERHWDTWLQTDHYLSFLSADMDGLKQINDTYGHGEGDWAICQLADVLKSASEEYGIVARTGGDEFLIVMCNEDEQIASVVTEDINKKLAQLNQQYNKPYLVACSIGSYVVSMKQDISLQECIWNSDREMYKIKKQKGSNRNDQ